MKPFVVTLFALAAAVSGEINHVAPGGPAGPNNLMNSAAAASVNSPQVQFAESRTAGDTYGAPAAPVVDSYSSSSSAGAWANDPAPQAYPYNFGGGASFAAPGFNANAEVGLPGQGFLNTALTIVFALVGFSLLIQLITKIMAAPFVANLFNAEGRSLDANTIMNYTNMAMNGIQKLQHIYENLE